MIHNKVDFSFKNGAWAVMTSLSVFISSCHTKHLCDSIK